MNKTKLKLFAGLILGLALVVGIMAPVKSQAESFPSLTNNMTSTASVVGWPTNSTGTNGLGFLTGSWIDVRNVNQADLWVQWTSVTNSSNFPWVITFTRSWADSPPVVSTDTNGVPNMTTFEMLPMFSITTTTNLGFVQTNNVQTWRTNLNESFLSGANYIGIYTITNLSAFANYYTNVQVGISKKILPIRFP
jgi:hypothetical protein